MIDPRCSATTPTASVPPRPSAGCPTTSSTEALAADDAPPRRDRRRSRRLRAEQKQLGKQIPQAQGEEKAGAAGPHQGRSSAEVKAAEAAQTEADEAWRRR